MDRLLLLYLCDTHLYCAEDAVDCVFAADDVMAVPQEIKDFVEQYKQKIINGEIVPPTVIKN